MLILASGGFLAELFYKYVPAFAQTRHIARVMFIFAFAASILAGFGYNYISGILNKKIKWRNAKNIAFIAVILLILTELVFMKGIPKGFNIKDQLEQNELAKYLELDTPAIVELATSGKIPAVREGNNWKFERSKIDEWAGSAKVK